LDLRRPNKLKGVSNQIPFFYALGGSYGGVRGGEGLKGYATPQPLRQTLAGVKGEGFKGLARTDRRREGKYILTPPCLRGFGAGKVSPLQNLLQLFRAT